MKGILGLVVLLGIGVAAYFLMNGSADTPEATPAAETVEPEATEETVTEEVAEPVEEAADAVEGAVDALKEEAEAAVDEVKDELEDAKDALEDKVNDAVDDLKEEANSLLEGATGTGTQVLEGAADAANDATEGAGDAAESTADRIQGALEDALGSDGEAATTEGETTEAESNANLEHDAPAGNTMEILSQALTAEGFDGLAIRDAIQNSDMSDLKKTALEALVTTAEENPDQIQSVVAQLREALGL